MNVAARTRTRTSRLMRWSRAARRSIFQAAWSHGLRARNGPIGKSRVLPSAQQTIPTSSRAPGLVSGLAMWAVRQSRDPTSSSARTAIRVRTSSSIPTLPRCRCLSSTISASSSPCGARSSRVRASARLSTRLPANGIRSTGSPCADRSARATPRRQTTSRPGRISAGLDLIDGAGSKYLRTETETLAGIQPETAEVMNMAIFNFDEGLSGSMGRCASASTTLISRSKTRSRRSTTTNC